MEDRMKRIISGTENIEPVLYRQLKSGYIIFKILVVVTAICDGEHHLTNFGDQELLSDFELPMEQNTAPTNI